MENNGDVDPSYHHGMILMVKHNSMDGGPR